MDLVGESQRKIIVRWLWDRCHLVDGGRAFVVEIPAERAPELLAERSGDDVTRYLTGVSPQTSLWPGTVTDDHVTCIVSADGRVIDAFVDPWFPYANLWNAYCPLRRLGIRIADLADLVSIPAVVIQKALDDDMPSTWCLDPSAWDGTDLGAGRG